MTDEMKPLDEKPEESQPYQPADEYTPPSAEPPEGMTDTTPDESLFAPPTIDASSFEGAEPEPVAPQAEPAPTDWQPEPVKPFEPAPAAAPSSSYSPPPPTYRAPAPPPAKGGVKWWVIVLIILAVLCCCCLVVAAVLWQYGDQWFGDWIEWSRTLSLLVG